VNALIWILLVKNVPSWFPLATFKRYAQKSAPIVIESVEKPYNEVKRRMVR
jgi:hypothetical protein